MRRSTALVTAASRSIYASLSRPSLLPFSYVETIDLETSRVTLQALAGAAGDVSDIARNRRSAR